MFTLILIVCNILLLTCVIKSIRADKAQQTKEAEKKQQEKQLLKESLRFFIPKIEHAKTLRELFTLHIQAWANGVQHSNIGPDKYGIFRTQDILKMQPEEVYLGNICGMVTKQLTYWETVDDEDSKQIVIAQYRHLLLSNLKWMQQNV